jgi:hypothetical protein
MKLCLVSTLPCLVHDLECFSEKRGALLDLSSPHEGGDDPPEAGFVASRFVNGARNVASGRRRGLRLRRDGPRRVDEREIEPDVKLMDKSRTDGTFSRSDFIYDPGDNVYVCPGGKA